jgi:hypothetical protein
VYIGDKKYEIINPTTQQEKHDQERLRKELISELLKNCYSHFVDNLHGNTKDILKWDDIIIFSYGHPQENYQLEKIQSETSDTGEEVNNSNQRALNEESVIVQWQDQNRYKDEDFTKLEEND